MTDITEQTDSVRIQPIQTIGSTTEVIDQENLTSEIKQYGKSALSNIDCFVTEDEVTDKAVVKMIISETYRLTSENTELKKYIPQYNQVAIENARLTERVDNKSKIKVTSELTSMLGGALLGASFSATGDYILYFIIAGFLLILISFYTNHI